MKKLTVDSFPFERDAYRLARANYKRKGWAKRFLRKRDLYVTILMLERSGWEKKRDER